MKNKMEDYLGNLDDFKEKIAKMCIDWTGVVESDYAVLVWAKRNNNVFLEYHKNGISGDNTYQIFRYEFPMFYYRDMPSGYYVRRTLDGVFYLVDGYEDFEEEIDINDLTTDLVYDLIERNYDHFNDNWNEFLTEFQKWLESDKN